MRRSWWTQQRCKPLCCNQLLNVCHLLLQDSRLLHGRHRGMHAVRAVAKTLVQEALPAASAAAPPRAPTEFEYDAVIVGSGIGGLTTATQMAAKGAKVVVLEK